MNGTLRHALVIVLGARDGDVLDQSMLLYLESVQVLTETADQVVAIAADWTGNSVRARHQLRPSPIHDLWEEGSVKRYHFTTGRCIDEQQEVARTMPSLPALQLSSNLWPSGPFSAGQLHALHDTRASYMYIARDLLPVIL